MNPDDLKPAPGALRLIQRFVNTRSLMRGYDLLEDPETATMWLAESGYYLQQGRVVEEGELGRLRELREWFRDILLSHNLGPSARTEQAAAGLDRVLESAALGISFDSLGQPSLVSSSGGIEELEEDLMSAAIWARYTGIWQRLKVCSNDECRWAFYDSSKNRSGSWCVMDICGSRAKMRAYYRRRRTSKTS